MRNTLLETIQKEWIAQFKEEALSSPLKNRLARSNFDGISVYMESHHATLFNHLKSTFPLCMRLVGKTSGTLYCIAISIIANPLNMTLISTEIAFLNLLRILSRLKSCLTCSSYALLSGTGTP
ncbi:hypothetical protein PGH45_15900 [Legionella pneumophila]|nr:hypothetical protein [Legionella pneumophila]